MFVGPFGALQKSSRTGFFKFFFKNLVPVSIGNIIGGTLLMAGVQHLAFGSRALGAAPAAPSKASK